MSAPMPVMGMPQMPNVGALAMEAVGPMTMQEVQHPLYQDSETGYFGTHKGLTRMHKNAGPLLVYRIPLHPSAGSGCCGCGGADQEVQERSYTWIAENRIEFNKPLKNCCGHQRDMVIVSYFDSTWGIMPNKGGCCGGGDPNAPLPAIEFVDDRWMCCCTKCYSPTSCFSKCLPCFFSEGESVSVVPYETCPMPLCCCPNRASALGNLCGLFGPQTGNPFTYYTLIDGIKDEVSAAKAAEMLTEAAAHYGSKLGWPARNAAKKYEA